MNTRFLSEEEVTQVQSIMAAFGVEEFGAEVRLWGRGKAIQVSGTLDKLELSCLLAISHYLDDAHDSRPRDEVMPDYSLVAPHGAVERAGPDTAFAVA